MLKKCFKKFTILKKFTMYSIKNVEKKVYYIKKKSLLFTV